VRHVVIDLCTSGMDYTPGDSLSVTTPADPALVEACLAIIGASDDEALREAFTWQVDISRPLDRTLELLAMSAAPHDARALRRLAEGEEGAPPEDADLLDLLEAFPSARPPVADLVRSLPNLRPRLYSIASSLRATPGQVHLCVSVVRAERRGRIRSGVASAFLAERAVAHGPITAAITPSHFRLPALPNTPVIMVGPGTGIAPFRAFLQEREAAGTKSPAWLFFGDQHAASDFLFRDELQAWLADGTLTRLDTAFSRDQSRKIYVQDRMAEAGEDLWRWLQDGGHFYVCGDGTRMARDVDLALRGVARTSGGLDEAQAKDWVAALARQGRYQRDVY
jgi:sulfite reductase (NADPH) flavoprotein alpha-component